MGTNYYARPRPCPHPCAHCNPVDVHICKSLTMFQGYRYGPWRTSDPGPILSWRDWKDALLSEDVDVYDEYGTKHETRRFIQDVEATVPAYRRRQYDWVVDHGHAANDWLDGDGFSFTTLEFS